MEKLKLSEEEIIKLGKKLVQELQLEPSVNTLGRWMAHYIAELIKKAEYSEDEKERKAYKKECFKVILKLWKNREHLPNVSKPLGELKPIIDLLEVLKERDYSDPFFHFFNNMPNDKTWKGFASTLKETSENIFELCLYSSLSQDLLKQKEEWLKDYKSMLAKEEIELLENLEALVNRRDSLIYFTDKEGEDIELMKLSQKDRYNVIFDAIESKLEKLTTSFSSFRNMIIKDLERKS